MYSLLTKTYKREIEIQALTNWLSGNMAVNGKTDKAWKLGILYC
jgi:hypothetical protein